MNSQLPFENTDGKIEISQNETHELNVLSANE